MKNPSFVKPRIVFSRCLVFAACRYDGMILSDKFTEKLSKKIESITVCPEVMIGLGIPRDPIRVVSTPHGRILLQPSTGRNITEEMKMFTAKFLDSLSGIDGFILKGKSPSCGIKNVKQFSVTGEIIGRGAGFFGDAVLERFPHLAVEDESRLADFKIRDYFLTRIFTFARLRKAVSQGSISALIRFHTQNRLLLMAYNQKVLGGLDRLLVNPHNEPVEEVIHMYEQTFRSIFSKVSSRSSNIKVLKHALGYFSGRLSEEEKNSFAGDSTLYKEGKIPLSHVISVMKAWINRYQVRYLMSQTFFSRYPDELGD